MSFSRARLACSPLSVAVVVAVCCGLEAAGAALATRLREEVEEMKTKKRLVRKHKRAVLDELLDHFQHGTLRKLGYLILGSL